MGFCARGQYLALSEGFNCSYHSFIVVLWTTLREINRTDWSIDYRCAFTYHSRLTIKLPQALTFSASKGRTTGRIDVFRSLIAFHPLLTSASRYNLHIKFAAARTKYRQTYKLRPVPRRFARRWC